MMIDAATTRIFEVPLDGPAAAVCPPDLTDARPRVVELWDRYGQLASTTSPSRLAPARVLRTSPVLQHGTDGGVGVLEDLHRASTVDGT